MGTAQGPEHLVEPLLSAIQAGDAGRVRELLHLDPSLVSAKTPDGASAILFAVYSGHPELVEIFEDHGALLNICEAAAAGQRLRVETLLERSPALAREYSSDGYPVLGLAAFFGHAAIARKLLEHGADINAPSRNAQQVTPLHAAAARRDVDLVREFLAGGAEPDAQQAGGFTALHTAAYHGDRSLAELLLGFGADPRKETSEGKTAAALASERGHYHVTELFSATA